MSINVSAVVHTFRAVFNPSLVVPHITVPTFAQLPIPIPHTTPIKVVILDKDNCFAVPHTNEVYHEYEKQWELLKKEYPGDRLMIVSNSAGSSDDIGGQEARLLQQNTGVKVFKHAMKKPGCYSEILQYLKSSNLIDHPGEVAVVGDRLLTDVLMAKTMGSCAVWIKDGVVPGGAFSQIEKSVYNMFKK